MSTALTVQDLGRDKIELIKQTVAKGATDLELELFLHACKHTGLDPLMKQIYAIKRWSQADGREVMSFQTGIDGLRLIADRTGQYAGSDEPLFQLGADGFPDVASVTVYKLVGSLKCAFTHSVRWKEYVQLKKDGTPTAFWVRMPFGQLGKCAESGALRKAFPMELSGLYTHDEMMQADNESKGITQTFAEKFPEQAQKIQEKLKPAPAETGQGDGARRNAGITGENNPLTAQQDGDAPVLSYAQEYISKAKLSESVRECSQVGNEAEADLSLNDADRKSVRTVVMQRMQELGKK